LPVGSHSITAVYGGSTNFSGSTSSALTQTVNKESSSTTVSSSEDPSNQGDSITFTALLSTNATTGTVQFVVDGTNFGTSVAVISRRVGLSILYYANSSATSSLSPGNHTVKANYSGNNNIMASSSGTLSQTVKAVKPVASFTANENPISGYAPVTVSFKDTSTNFPTSWSWNFGDRSEVSTSENPSHRYTTAGSYTVTLTVKNSAGSSSASKIISVRTP
jgi:PKD repeat protein